MFSLDEAGKIMRDSHVAQLEDLKANLDTPELSAVLAMCGVTHDEMTAEIDAELAPFQAEDES